MKKLLAILLCACMILSLAACGKKEEAPPDEEAKTPEEAVQSGEAKIAETIVIGKVNDLDSVDPYGTTSAQTHMYTNSTFRTLTKVDPASGELVGVLAESWEDISGDATVWNVKLREGVKFHDGSTLDAEDIKFTWEYAKDATKVVKPIAGADDMVKEVVVVDPLTVQFVLNYAIPDFMTYLEIKIYSKDAFDSMDPAEAAQIGCGPYMVGERISGVSNSLVRFDDYYEGIDQFPSKEIVIKVFADVNTELAALEAGEIAYMPVGDMRGVDYNTLKSNDNITIYTGNGVMSYYVGFNHRKDVWKDTDMRLALAKAINKDDIINIYFEGGVSATRSDNFCVPTGAGYDDSVKSPEYDLEGAKALLEKCGKVGQEVKIMVSADSKPMGEVIQAQLNAAGFNAIIDQVDGTNWTDLKKTGDYDIFAGDYCSYAGALLYNFNRFFSEGGSSNMFNFYDKEFEDGLAKVRACTTYEDMLAEFGNLQQWVADNVPLIPVAVNTALLAAQNDVGGIQVYPSANLTEYSYLYTLE